jgi:hypothetical protein
MHTWLRVQTLVIFGFSAIPGHCRQHCADSTYHLAAVSIVVKRQNLSRCYWFSRDLCVDSIGRCNAVCPVCWPTSPITLVASTSSV